jgi:DNA-directed RNA polymerase specialized sigma24 family protein
MKQEEQLTNQQIADILGTDPRSVATLISKARHQLFNDLKRRNRNENK